jgi:hypothetical protein
MKQIGLEIGVNESRVSQLHARAIGRLRQFLGTDPTAASLAEAVAASVVPFTPAAPAGEMLSETLEGAAA